MERTDEIKLGETTSLTITSRYEIDMVETCRKLSPASQQLLAEIAKALIRKL